MNNNNNPVDMKLNQSIWYQGLSLSILLEEETHSERIY